MTDSIPRRGRNRGRTPRRDRRPGPWPVAQAQAVARLSAYLDAVTAALAEHGWLVARCTLSSTGDLEAVLTLRPAEPSALDSGLAQPVRIRWEEDTGWCVSHHLLGAGTPPLHHYLHTELVPPPAEAARFIVAVLDPPRDPYDPDFAWVGMPYPTQFRSRSQPLDPVLDALERAASHPDTPDGSTTAQPSP